MENAGKRLSVLTRADFFKACQALIEEKNWAMRERPNAKAVAEKLTQMIGVRVSDGNIQTIREATGINWTAKRKNIAGKCHSHVGRILTKAVRDLYIKMGEPVPNALEGLFQRMFHAEESDCPPPPLPSVFSVPIAAANLAK